MQTAIWWLRRDLRLTDNQALHAALAQAERVLPVFILDPALLASPYNSDKRLSFLLAGLRQLDAALRQRGSYLVVRRGAPLQVLADLLVESGAGAILAEADFSPYARGRDQSVSAHLPLRLVGGPTVHHPGAVLKANGTPYTVYTPYSRAWKTLFLPTAADLLLPPVHLTPPPPISGDPLPLDPVLSPLIPFLPGETEAERRLQAFAGQIETLDESLPLIYGYTDGRNRLDTAGTSHLSPYLRFGMLSARQAVAAAQHAIETASTGWARQAAETWLNELIWREFYVSILYHFPRVRGHNFRPEYDRIKWRNDESTFAAWTAGRTGYPVVDAAMRQLVATGWLPNRARMLAASFLVKNLLIDWRWGERWFMQHLIDGDPAANNGGWQWTAGVGTDAAPYFRVFNPVLQGQKFDPDGLYVRRWLPELVDVQARFIHTPWEMPLETQRQSDCVIGRDYPAPIIDLAQSRERALAAYARQTPG